MLLMYRAVSTLLASCLALSVLAGCKASTTKSNNSSDKAVIQSDEFTFTSRDWGTPAFAKDLDVEVKVKKVSARVYVMDYKLKKPSSSTDNQFILHVFSGCTAASLANQLGYSTVLLAPFTGELNGVDQRMYLSLSSSKETNAELISDTSIKWPSDVWSFKAEQGEARANCAQILKSEYMW